MAYRNKEKSNLAKELVNIIIGGALIGLFSLFLLPTKAIEFWWLVWAVSSISILIWKLVKNVRNPIQKKEVD